MSICPTCKYDPEVVAYQQGEYMREALEAKDAEIERLRVLVCAAYANGSELCEMAWARSNATAKVP